MKPSTWLPESPMNTDAFPRGRRLNGRKPRHATASESASTSTTWLGCCVTASTAKNAAAIVASVAARPSMLSRRLNAFVIPTSQITATMSAMTSLPIICNERPPISTQHAARTWAPSFTTGPSERTSSAKPATKRIAEPTRIAASSFVPGAAPAAMHAPIPARKPAKIPTPPRSGVARVCQRSCRGAATTSRPSGDRTTAQITIAATGSPAATATNLTRTSCS